eukprot:365947-Chlamydomonas_euryale.AAC.11
MSALPLHIRLVVGPIDALLIAPQRRCTAAATVGSRALTAPGAQPLPVLQLHAHELESVGAVDSGFRVKGLGFGFTGILWEGAQGEEFQPALNTCCPKQRLQAAQNPGTTESESQEADPHRLCLCRAQHEERGSNSAMHDAAKICMQVVSFKDGRRRLPPQTLIVTLARHLKFFTLRQCQWQASLARRDCALAQQPRQAR